MEIENIPAVERMALLIHYHLYDVFLQFVRSIAKLSRKSVSPGIVVIRIRGC